jgi:glyoxylase-like metal-dependent hydrolase (beta-lactamase superfamily II)
VRKAPQDPRRYRELMPKVWTRHRAGTGSARLRSSARAAGPVVRNPVPDRPQIHQIELPLAPSPDSRAPETTQIYLIEGEPLTLIDTGVQSVESRAVLEAALGGLGYGLAEIERVIVTHSHHDHFGSVESIRAAGANLECWVHALDAELVEDFSGLTGQRMSWMTELFREFGVPGPLLERLEEQGRSALKVFDREAQATKVDRRLTDGDRVEWRDWGLRVVHSPGHTPGHILLEDEELGVLFTGDQIMAAAIPNAENFYLSEQAGSEDLLARRPRFRGLVEMRRSLRRLRGRPYGLILPGYGTAIRRADRAIRDTLLFYEVRLQRIDRGLRHLAAMGQDVTAYEIWKALFPVDESLAETRAHLLLLVGALDCLEEDGLLVTERRSDGVLTHHHR